MVHPYQSQHEKGDHAVTISEPPIIPDAPVPPQPPLRHRAHALRISLRRVATRQTRRVISRLLGLSWRLQVTVCVDVDIFADDADAARAHLEAVLLHPDSRIVVYTAGRSTNTPPWQPIGSAPILALHDTATSFDDLDQLWNVTTSVTGSIIIAAEDADDPYSDSDVEADWPQEPCHFLVTPDIIRHVAWEKTRTLTRLRRRHPR